MLSPYTQEGSLRAVAANLENNLGAHVEADPVRRAAVQRYLGRIAALRPSVVFFSEAAPHGSELISGLQHAFPHHLGFVFDDNDRDRNDRHRNALLIDPALLGGNVRAVRLAGRDALQVPVRVGDTAVNAVFAHLLDRPRERRAEQARQLARLMKDDRHALAAGDFNTIPAGAWQAKAMHWATHAEVLGRRPFKWMIDHLPSVDPGEALPEFRHFGILGKMATFAARKAVRFGSLTRRLVDMAEGPGEGGPLEILQEQAGLQLVAMSYRVTRRLSRLTGQLGVPIDHAVQKGMLIQGFDVLHADGASDHDGIVMDLKPLVADDYVPAGR